MNNTKPKNPKSEAFNGVYKPRIKRIRQQPRIKIRQLLRSFISLGWPGQVTKPQQQPGQP